MYMNGLEYYISTPLGNVICCLLANWVIYLERSFRASYPVKVWSCFMIHRAIRFHISHIRRWRSSLLPRIYSLIYALVGLGAEALGRILSSQSGRLCLQVFALSSILLFLHSCSDGTWWYLSATGLFKRRGTFRRIQIGIGSGFSSF